MITFINDETGKTKEVKDGYSFTVLFFGFWALLFRTQWIPALLFFFGINLLDLFTLIPGLSSLPVAGIAFIAKVLYAIVANDHLQQKLLKKGYRIRHQTETGVSLIENEFPLE